MCSVRNLLILTIAIVTGPASARPMDLLKKFFGKALAEETLVSGLFGKGESRKLRLVETNSNGEVVEYVISVPQKNNLPSTFENRIPRYNSAPGRLPFTDGASSDDEVRQIRYRMTTAGEGKFVVTDLGPVNSSLRDDFLKRYKGEFRLAEEFTAQKIDGQLYRVRNRTIQTNDVEYVNRGNYGFEFQTHTTRKIADDGRSVSFETTNPYGNNRFSLMELDNMIPGQIIYAQDLEKRLKLVVVHKGKVTEYQFARADKYPYDYDMAKPVAMTRLVGKDLEVHLTTKVIHNRIAVAPNQGVRGLSVGSAQ